MSPWRWHDAIVLIAAIKVMAGLLAAGIELGRSAPRGEGAPFEVLATHGAVLLVYGGAAALLLWGGRRDRRAVELGALFTLIASSFGRVPLRSAGEAHAILAAPFDLLRSLQPETLLPFFFWSFIHDFPRPPTARRMRQLIRWLRALSAVIGVALFATGALLYFITPEGSALLAALAQLLARGDASYYDWVVLFALVIPGFPVMFHQARNALVPERRRVRLFVASLLAGMAPVTIVVVLEEIFPPVARTLRAPGIAPWIRVLVFATLLSVPITTSYSVLIDRVLDVRLVVRKALQHALARYTVLAAMGIPLLPAVWLLWVNRHRPLAELLSGYQALGLAAVVLAGSVLLAVRGRLLDAIDRRFFREQYDARQTLAELAERSRDVVDAAELQDLLRQEIDRALHLQTLAVFLRDPRTGHLKDPEGRLRSLDLTSELARTLEARAEPVQLSAESAASPLERLPVEDGQWVVDHGFSLLVPMIGSDGALLGLIALGDKRSELPFSREDRLLLGTIAASASLTLENRLLRLGQGATESRPVEPSSLSGAGSEDGSPRGAAGGTDDGPGTDPARDREGGRDGLSGPAPGLARECPNCGSVQPESEPRCELCDKATEATAVPYVLAGKFRLERRVGAGGMGVVYRGIDLDLARPVAVKTLPRMAPRLSMRLRREARAMASVSHPNLALIFGAESWRGVPFLIFEYLPGGTLADRIETSPLSLAEVLDLGLILADVVGRIHKAGILHRDIKPSNIGFSADGTLKLMDFGLARVLQEVARASGSLHPTSWTGEVGRPDPTAATAYFSAAAGLLGTPAYLPPEAIRGARPSAALDLWAIAVVLHEAFTGHNPFHRDSVKETLQAIVAGHRPAPSRYRPDCPEDLAAFFDDALSKGTQPRPANAAELWARLHRLRQAAEAAGH